VVHAITRIASVVVIAGSAGAAALPIWSITIALILVSCYGAGSRVGCMTCCITALGNEYITLGQYYQCLDVCDDLYP